MNIELPYGRDTLNLHTDDRIDILTSKPINVMSNFERDLDNKLKTMKATGKVAILVPDYTRPVPTNKILKHVIKAVKTWKVDEIVAIVALGLHRACKKKEMENIFGGLMDEIEVMNHNPDENLVYIGTSTFGNDIYVNEVAVECDTVISIGSIEPHFFAGYSGGRKYILPGISGRDTIRRNHSFSMIENHNARNGVLDGNPIHEEMVEASRFSNHKYAIDVTFDRNKNITGIFCGEPIKEHIEGVRFIEKYLKLRYTGYTDIVITSNGGAPLDLNLYQTVKGISVAENIIRKNSTIIVASECSESVGHKSFEKMLKRYTVEEFYDTMKTKDFLMDDQWQVQILYRILKRCEVIVVSEKLKDRFKDERLKIFEDISEAYRYAKSKYDRAKTVAVPEGPYVVVDRI